MLALTLRQALGVSLLIHVRSDRQFKYLGPVKGNEISPELMERIRSLRNRIQGVEAPSPQNDERSTHFYALDKKGEIAGALRLTPEPFEISTLTPELAVAASRYAQFFEISRYAVERKHADMAERLLFFAGVWILRKSTAAGVIALCSEKLKEYYRHHYGIKEEDISESFLIPERKSAPHFIVKVEFSKLFRQMMERFVLRKKAEPWP